MNKQKSKTKISYLTNRYPVQKTLCQKLIPIGRTLEFFENRRLLEEDLKRSEDYEKVKAIIDNYHKAFIDNVLRDQTLSYIKEYAELYYGPVDEKRKKEINDISAKLRKEIADAFKKSEIFGKLFKKEMITQLLPEFIDDAEQQAFVEEFFSFTTYFRQFFENRKNIYSDKEISTAIAYRSINENLPKFLDNIKVFDKAKELLPSDVVVTLNNDFEGLHGTTVFDVFSVDYFNFVLNQSGIDRYNEIIGGYTTSDGTKVKGINEYINDFNQHSQKSDRIPKLKPLYKQILSEKESVSFIPEKFNSDDEVLNAILDFYNHDEPDKCKSIKSTVDELKALFKAFSDASLNGIYIKNGPAVTDLSNGIFKSWTVIKNLWNASYDKENYSSKVKNFEKYEEKRNKAYKAKKHFSLGELQKLITSSEDTEINTKSISDYYCGIIFELADNIYKTYSLTEKLLTMPYDISRSFSKDKKSVELIKNFLDSIKNLERLIKPLSETGEIFDKNELFYSIFTPLYDNLSRIDRLYDKVRNYVTKKPYSTEKIKLNFDNPQFLGGWDRSKEKDYRSALLIKDGKYFLAILDKGSGKVFENLHFSDYTDDYYEKAVYKLLPGPNKMLPKVFFADSNIDFFAPSDEILTIYKKGTFKKSGSFNIDDCHKLIDFYKDAINRNPDWSTFNFTFKDTCEYNDISEFYNDVANQGYKITFSKIPAYYIDELVGEGKIYLFQIYNKDFSPYSKGTPNLHTMYFKMLFDERNLENVVYRLNGGAEMFYRPASIKSVEITHPKNQPIKNKNELSENKTSVFKYDLIKDKRYTKPQFSLHFPITMNFQSPDVFRINDDVRMLLRDCEKNCVIGIDRGERNLIYYSVIDSNGVILEQDSLNIIKNEYKGEIKETNYHSLLDDKEESRKQARQNWNTIENIKELKNGYISQVVHKICKLVVHYDAIIVLEDLNSGFKNNRTKVEKQVYQKFEKMLIDKLNYYADKQIDPEKEGGLLNAYQLTNKFESFKKEGVQNGIIFYVPAWLTSKIDPVTGFVDLMKPRYSNVEESKSFLSRFKSIGFNEKENYFEFSFDYSDFLRGSTDYRRKWTVCTFGERIKNYRNPERNSKWDGVTINLTEEFIKLFDEFSIDYHSKKLKELIIANEQKEFFEKLLHLLALTLQMRNSVSNSDIDYLISPVKDRNGVFYDSRKITKEDALPIDADANGAYNIARKGLWAIEQIKKAEDISKVKLSISNAEWLEFAQKGDMIE